MLLLLPLIVIVLSVLGLIHLGLKFFDALLIVIFSLSFLIFWFGLSICSKDYFEQTDGVDLDYTPFAHAHSLTLFTFYALSVIALVILWLKKRALPPLLLLMVVSMILIGVVINIFIIIQASDKINIVSGFAENDNFMFCLLPLSYLIIATVLFVRLLRSEANLSIKRNYQNLTLNKLNSLIGKVHLQPLWILLLTIPLFLLVTLILVLFGQAPHAITKVFTETTTWHFSTKSHPPLLNHKGHYLCTVAACGDPNVVKPIGWGERHGYPVLVNRQLQIANAFEELIQENCPGLHRVIRNSYDRYGYPLSKKINTPSGSNITYRLMKPLEYFFLITLYLTCINPEQKIAKQYSPA